jgi:dolichol-phosphate mannosyltransferase
MKLVSTVVPIYFEEEMIGELYRRLKGALVALGDGFDHEILFVNDGSTDDSLPRLRVLADADPRVRVIDLSRNFGHQLAITAGIDAASGDAVVVIDGDLQDPPEVIAEMVGKWQEGYGVVYGQRRSRAGESALKRVTARWFYRLLNSLSDTPLPLDTGDFRLMDRAVVDALCSMREEARYMRGMVSWLGFKQYALPYDRDARFAGTTKYTLSRMLRLATNGVTSFSARPLTLMIDFGVLVTLAALAVLVWAVVMRIARPDAVVQGWASTMVIVLFLGGVQLISLGVLGVYVGRVFMESKRRPLYVVSGRYGFTDHNAPQPCPHCGRPVRENGR